MPAIALRPRRTQFLARRRRSYYLFIAPALVVVGAVIVFPWLFTLWMSAFDWKIGSDGALRRLRQLRDARHQPALPRGDPPHVLFHGARRGAAARAGHGRGDDLPPRVPVARRAARRLHHADDGDAGRRRARLDDDVPSAAGRAQLPAVARRPAALALGVFADARDPEPRAGRDLALDAARHADRAGRPRRAADRALRVGAARRRHRVAALPLTSRCRSSRRSSSSPR